MLTALLNRNVDLYRVQTVPNGYGGFTEQRVFVKDVWIRVSQPSATELVMARTAVGPQQGGAEFRFPVYSDPDELIYRNDELVDNETGQMFRVVAVISPSAHDVYLRMDCEFIQEQPEQGDS